MATEKPALSAINKIKNTKPNLPQFPVPKGEVWLGTDLLDKAGLTDTLDHHLKLADQLGHDIVCLPVTTDTIHKPSLGYRYFDPGDVRTAVDTGTRFIAAAVDGPFQELVNQKGLMAVLTGWVRNRENLLEAYAVESKKSLKLIQKSLENGAHAIIITDDLAGDQGPMISPLDIEQMCSQFYKTAVKQIHDANSLAFLHSCGKITGLADIINRWQIDGLAAVQHSANDLVHLQTLFPSCVLMAGIDGNLLEAPLSDAAKKEFKILLTQLASRGGLILSSACGLYNGIFLEKIRHLYEIADNQLSLSV